LVTQAPAQWLAHGVAQLSHQRVLLTQAQGTVWQGSAQWVLSTGPRNGVPDATTDMALPTPVHWQIQPQFHRTTGVALGLRLSTDCCTLEPLTLSFLPLWGGLRVTIDDHQSQWPAHWLVGLGAPWNTIQPEGQMQLRTQGLSWQVQAGHAQLQGLAELQLQQLSTRLSTLRPLGSYRLQLRGGDTMAITLDTLEGSLQLQGNGQWLNQRLRFQGEASAAPEFEAALSNLLNILGQRRGAKSIMELS
jgi:general secretion pathway protein N